MSATIHVSGARITGLPGLDREACDKAIRYAAAATGARGAGTRLALLTGDHELFDRYRGGASVLRLGWHRGMHSNSVNGHIIWIDPNRAPHLQAKTLAHELAHLHTPNQHGRLWRHLYARLLCPVSDILGMPVDTTDAISACVRQYYQPPKTPRAREPYAHTTLITQEIDRLTDACRAGSRHYARWTAAENRRR